MISDETKEALKRVSLAKDVIGKFIPLKKVGADMVCCCPFHNEKSPSFKVKLNEDFWKCFGCGKTGDSIAFLQEYQKLSYVDAVKWLCDFYHIPLIEDKPQSKRIYKRPIPTAVKSELSPRVMKWFDTRGITTKTLTEFKITECSEWMPKANAVTDAICFNYYRNDELINIKYRAAEKDFKLSKDAELIFYNIDAVKGEELVIVTEGEIDCLSIAQTGLKNVVSVPNGASGGTQKLEYLNNCFDDFKDVKCIILFTDNDAPGMALRDELGRRFGFDR
jgi:DNA primase